MSELVKYNSQMNEVAFRRFTAEELNMFFLFCTKLKEKQEDKIILTFEEIKGILNYKSRNMSMFVNVLEETYTKMLDLKIKLVSEDKMRIKRFNLFNYYEIFLDKKEIIIKTNQEFLYILNTLDSFFTRFELDEFVKIKSTYSKAMYRLLKQYRTVGRYKISFEEFKRLLDVPGTYRISEIDRRVFNQIKKELSLIFVGLNIEKVKKNGKVVAFVFTFQKETVPNKKSFL